MAYFSFTDKLVNLPLERDFGFTPQITLREGLRRFANWYGTYYGI